MDPEKRAWACLIEPDLPYFKSTQVNTKSSSPTPFVRNTDGMWPWPAELP